MILLKTILENMKESILCFTPNRCFYESMMKFDFRIENKNDSMMQLCFSSLAAWPLYIGIILIYLDPTKLSWSLHKYLAEDSAIGFFMLDGRLSAMVTVFIFFFLFEWIFRKEYFPELFVFYFLLKSDIHLHLALSAILAIYFSRFCYLWWFHIELDSVTRIICKKVCYRLLLSWFLTAVVGLYGLNYLQFNQYFANSVYENRFEFLVIIIFFLHLAMLFFLGVWGHFFVRQKVDPSFLPTFFSTSTWILRFNMSYYLKKLLKDAVLLQIEKNKSHTLQFEQLKDQSPVIRLENIQSILKKEMTYLKDASSKLTID